MKSPLPVLLICAVLIFTGVVTGVYLGIVLTICCGVLFVHCLKKGIPFQEITHAAIHGGKKMVLIAQMLLLIGINSALWIASGCTPALLYYGMALISPHLFIVICFLLCCAMSFLQGSSFATVGTIGIVMAIIGRSGGIPEGVSIGTIVAGAYFGDRCSPVSSSLALVSAVTGTEHKKAVPIAVKSSVIPLLISIAIYLGLSFIHPLQSASYTDTSRLIHATYRIDLIALLPAVLIILLSLCRVNMLLCMGASIVAAAVISLAHQNVPFDALLGAMLSGYRLPATHGLSAMLAGGGALSMLKTIYIVFIACVLAGLVELADMIDPIIYKKLENAKSMGSLYLRTTLVALGSAAIGCNQTVSIVMTSNMMRRAYKMRGLPNSELLRDVSFAGILLSVAVPWTTAAMVPVGILGSGGLHYMPYMAFILIAPAYNWVYRLIKKKKFDNELIVEG